MKYSFYLLAMFFLMACSEDVPKLPSCYLTSYGRTIHIHSDTSIVRYDHEIKYDDKNRTLLRRNYSYNTTVGTTFEEDSLVYQHGKVTEIYVRHQGYILSRVFRLEYEDGLISTIHQYAASHNSDDKDLFLAASETLAYDGNRRLIELKATEYVNNHPSRYATTMYSYQGKNLSETHKISYMVYDQNDTSEIYHTKETFSNYDSLRNPFKGQIFSDLRHRAYSENNHRTYQSTSYSESGEAQQGSSATVYFEYNAQGYPEIGEYVCD